MTDSERGVEEDFTGEVVGPGPLALGPEGRVETCWGDLEGEDRHSR